VDRSAGSIQEFLVRSFSSILCVAAEGGRHTAWAPKSGTGGGSSIDGLARAGPDLRRRRNILEHGKAVGRFRHDRETKAALRAWLCKPRLLLMEIVGLILRMTAARANSDQPRALEFEIRDYVFYDRAGAHSPLFGVLVVGIHVPIFERFDTGPEADLIVPCRVVRVRPPGEMQKTRQGLELMPYTSEHQFELLVVADSPEPDPLHALIDCHDPSPEGASLMEIPAALLNLLQMQIACRRKPLADGRLLS
jgi:hypothetical protein